MSDQPKPIDLNSASLDEMANVPGIGPTIAARIQARRPYQSVDQLMNVPGIGEVALEKIRSYFFLEGGNNGQPHVSEPPQDQAEEETLSPDDQLYEAEVIALPVPDQEASLAEGEMREDMPEGAEEIGPSNEQPEPEILLAENDVEDEEKEPEQAETRPEPGPQVIIPDSKPATEKQPRYASRSDAFWISFGSSFLAFILAIGLTLGGLALINNGLRYVSPAQLSSVSRQVDGLSSQASILQQDLDGLRTRVDNLEGLSGRVSTVEETAKTLRSDLDAASTQVEQLNQSVSGLQTDVTDLKSVSDRFQNFLDGLRELLNNGQ